jgi:UDP-glucose 4-epimerase
VKILVTGAAGFVGSSLCNHLEGKVEYSGVDNLQFGYKENLKNQNIITCGFETLDESFLNDFDVLVHLACANIIYAQDHPLETFKTNGINTMRLFKKFKGKIVYTSTASVYGQADKLPTSEDAEIRDYNAYDQSKYTSEFYLAERGNYTILRLSNVYGQNQRPDHPYSGVIGKFIGRARLRKPFIINGDGLATRDYTYIDDVIDALCKAVERPAINDAVNISTSKDTSTLMVAYMIAGLFKIPFDVQAITFEKERSIDRITSRCICNHKAYIKLGWRPKITLEEGLKLIIVDK